MRKIAIILLIVTLSSPAAAAEATQLKEADIRSQIIGKTIYLAAPMGGEFPLNYHPSGEVDGSGKALGLGKFIQPTDKGRWWIQSDKLCQQFKVWYDGSPMAAIVWYCGTGVPCIEPLL